MSQQINLYRPIFRKQKRKFSAIAMAQAGVAIIGGVIVIYGLLWWQVVSLRSEVQQADARLVAATQRLQEVSRKLGPDTSLETKAAMLEQQVAARMQLQNILSRGLFTNTTGYSDYFLALARQHVSGVWLTAVGINGAGESLTLAGRANDPAKVPRYVQRLGVEQALAGQEFQVFLMTRPEIGTASQTSAPYVEFMFKTTPAKEQGKS